MSSESQDRVHDLLKEMPSHGIKAAKQLFWSELNYDRANQRLSRRKWPERARAVLADAPLILARHETQFGDFDVVYARLAGGQVD